MNRLLLAMFFSVLSLPAFADYFVWQDPDTKLSVTFPDTWKTQNNQNPDDIMTIAAPSGNDRAQCVIKTKSDHRYTTYPSDFGSAIQKTAVSIPFWQDYMAHYDDSTLNLVYDDGGLGRWLASYAYATYDNHNGTILETRRAIMFASLYYDRLYIVECSALNHAFDKWHNNFKSIIKSIDFQKAFHERKGGEYADFMSDVETYFWAQTGGKGTVEY